ncbi:MAG: hypothetical protein QXN87_06845 [Candidatus Bathyarchaeia archaeon]
MIGVYAALTLWSVNVSVNVASPDIGVYWDQSCTNPVSTIDFGSYNKGDTASKTLYIKNKGSTTITLLYTSTLSSVSGGKIVDEWTYSGGSVNGVSLAPGQVISSTYTIEISSTCPAQTFNWVISLGI